jgi:hypothetical protein
MKFLNSWKFYMGMIILGFAIWFLAGLFSIPKPEPYEMQKGLDIPGTPMSSIPVKSIYPEIKFWAESGGKFLVGLGGVASAIKALLELFRRKKNSDIKIEINNHFQFTNISSSARRSFFQESYSAL